MIMVYLTCTDDNEAEKITDVLLDKRLVACAKKLPIKSSFWWEGKKDKADEVLVLLETVEEKFEQIETEVMKLHSYDTPMLFAIHVLKTTDAVTKWLKEEIK